jgi:hypothetical protein
MPFRHMPVISLPSKSHSNYYSLAPEMQGFYMVEGMKLTRPGQKVRWRIPQSARAWERIDLSMLFRLWKKRSG